MGHGVQPVLNKEDLQDIFPELAESEDERMRTGLINGFKECLKNSQYPKNAQKYWHNIKIEDILAWLEKQGKQKPNDRLEPLIDDEIDLWIKENSDIHHDNNDIVELMRDMAYYVATLTRNLYRQNPKWTEEDEKCIDNCCLLIGAADNCYEKTFKDDCIHYLQNLKEKMGV